VHQSLYLEDQVPWDSTVELCLTDASHTRKPTYDNQAIQLSKLSGYCPIIITSSTKYENYLKTLGATHVVDRDLPPLLEIKKIANQSIPFVFDAIGDRSTQQAGLDILAPGGTLVTVLVEKVGTRQDNDTCCGIVDGI
jgi:NADPH:quinone reductase-like Zn-dependent oxidoreductase